MINQTTNRLTLETNSKQCAQSPYLPPNKGVLKEKLLRLRYRAAYHIWKRMLCRYLQQRRVKFRPPLRFLDVGCGPGHFIRCLEHWFSDSEISGLDMHPELLKFAHDQTKKARLLQGGAEHIPFADATFHVLSGLQVVEHLAQPEKFLAEANRVLHKDGLLLLATPNPDGLAARLLKERWPGIRDDHISVQSIRVWQNMLKENNFTILNEGTTLFNSIPLVGGFPLGLPFQLAQAVFGWFRWEHGASYMVISEKKD